MANPGADQRDYSFLFVKLCGLRGEIFQPPVIQRDVKGRPEFVPAIRRIAITTSTPRGEVA
jgi:hypothetical protein